MNLVLRNHNTENQKGFTLIEVVLVLAIGGLIFLLAFLAFQQVSRNRRDTQRRSDLNLIVGQIEAYGVDGSSINRLPPSTINTMSTPNTGHIAVFASKYLMSYFDPSARNRYHNITSVTGNYQGGIVGAYEYDFGPINGSVDCEGVLLPTNDKYVIRMNLESGRSCRDNT